MNTMKIIMIYVYEKLLLFVGCRCHEERKIVMVYFKNKQKRLSIHVFITSLSQIEKCQ